MASLVPAGNGSPFASCSMLNDPIPETSPAIATRIVFTCEGERAKLAGAETRDERLGGTDARGGPLGNEESRGRLAGGAEAGATLVAADNMGTGGKDDLRVDGGSDLRGGGRTDDGRAGGGKDEPATGGHGGSFAGGARKEPRSRTSDGGADDAVEASPGAGAPFINFAVA